MSKKIVTAEHIKMLTVEKRSRMYANACALSTPEAFALKILIEEIGLPFKEDRAFKPEDDLGHALIEIIFSSEGRRAALDATEAGLAAMANVDPLIQARLDQEYGPHDNSTVRAGEIVGALMRSLDYVKGPQADLPLNCVARSAATWSKNKKQ